MAAPSSLAVATIVASPRVRGNKFDFTVSGDTWPLVLPYGLAAVEVWGSLTNSFATATKVGEGKVDYHHAGLGEEETWYYWFRCRDRGQDPSYGPWNPVSTGGGLSCKTLGQASSAFTLNNGKVVATVAGNALTIAIKTAGGADPSPQDPIFVAFRDRSDAGKYNTRSIQAPMSLVVPNGAKMAASDGTRFRLWVFLHDYDGALALIIANCYSPTTGVHAFPEESLWSYFTLAVGAGSSGVLYGASPPPASGAIRAVASLQWAAGLTTAGVWTTTPLVNQAVVGGRRPGQVVSSMLVNHTATDSTTNAIPFDDTVPDFSTEGKNVFNDIIPISDACNVVEIEATINCTHSVASEVAAYLYMNGVAHAVAWSYVPVGGAPVQINLSYGLFTSGAANVAAFIMAGGSAAGTFYLNRTAAGRRFGGILTSTFKAREVVG